MYLLSVGFDNYVVASRVTAVVGCSSAPIRRMIREYRTNGGLLDATQGRRMRALRRGRRGGLSLLGRRNVRGANQGRSAAGVGQGAWLPLRHAARLVEERLAAGDDVILKIDVQGGLNVKEQRPDAVLIFLLP